MPLNKWRRRLMCRPRGRRCIQEPLIETKENSMRSISDVSRREFLGRTGTIVAGAAFAATLADSASAARGPKVPVGLQLYSIREQCAADLPGMLAAVSKIGYRGVEFAGYHNRSAKELRKMLDDNGLVACGTHTPYETIQPDQLAATIEFNRTIGNQFLIVPWMEGKSKEDWLAKAKLFNEVAAKVKREGMWVGYHAHAHDFTKFDGQAAWDIFFGNTRKEVVMQMDTSNCLAGGADPVAILKKYAGRARSIHLKAHGGSAEAVIGEDQVNWKEVFKFCETKGKTQWYVLEHESSKDPLDAVRRSFQALRTMGKV